jgi:hypothetical protein
MRKPFGFEHKTYFPGVQFKMSHLFWVPPSRLSAGCINGKFQISLLTWLQCTDNQEIAPNRDLPKAVL